MGKAARDFFTAAEQEAIKQAIQNAELATSGEVRVHLESECTGDVLDRAATVFKKLGMVETKQRNGILFYLSINSHKFAVIGDSGINTKVPEDFWEKIKTTVLDHFRENRYSQGLIDGITIAGSELKKWFPYQSDDKNELPDDISFGSQKLDS
jgi:uncharacterized membrane protein